MVVTHDGEKTFQNFIVDQTVEIFFNLGKAKLERVQATVAKTLRV